VKLYSEWKVDLPGGESYVWRPDDTTLAEALMLETETGTSFDDWVSGIDARSAIPCQVLVWFLRRQDGRQEDRMSVDFPIRRLSLTHYETPGDADPEASAGSEPATPEPSPTTTESDPGNGTDSPGLTSVA
jgi:hypothetical protein